MEYRTCRKCGDSKPLSKEHFYKHSGRPCGFDSKCSTCEKADQKAARLQHPHLKKLFWYRTNDKKRGLANDLTPEFIQKKLEEPCEYCGTTEDLRGLDRLDNAQGHTQANVVTCCALCNYTRNDHFTPNEFKLIGDVIAQIRKTRNESRTDSR